MGRLSARARLAFRLASIAALATGGVVLGRGVVGMVNSRAHVVDVAGVSVSRADARAALPVDATAAPGPADGALLFTSSLRSWAAETAGPPSILEDPDPVVAADPPDETILAAQPAAPAIQPRPTPAPVAPPVQLPAGPPGVLAAPGTGAAETATSPEAAVRSFYALVEQGQFDRAAGLWSQRMRSSYPPAENITSRFADTQAVTINRADVVQLDPASGQATVAVSLVELRGPGPVTTRQYVGKWYLVRGPSGWLLDQPSLQQS